MNKIILLYVFLGFSFFTLAQDSIVLNVKAKYIAVDPLLNIYALNDDALVKYDKQGAKMHQYSNSLLGNISSFDVSNPLRILLFYDESNAIVFLNQQMTEINEPLYLNTLDDLEASVASSSSSGGFWVFDRLSMSLKYFDSQRKNTIESDNLSFALHENEPFGLVENNQMVYLQTKNKILVFDVYGSYLKEFISECSSVLFVSAQHWQQFKNCRIVLTHKVLFEQEFLDVKSCNDLLDAKFIQGKLYAVYPNRVVIKSMN